MHSARGLCKHSQTTQTSVSSGFAVLQQPRFQVSHTAHQQRTLSASSFPSWTSNGSITARNKKERLSWRLSEITDPSPSLPSAEQQAPLQELQTPQLQQPMVDSQPEELSVQIATTTAEAAQQAPTAAVTADPAATLLDATVQPPALSNPQPPTPPGTSIMYTEGMLRASKPAAQLNPEPPTSKTTSPIPVPSSLPQNAISTDDSISSTPPPPTASLPLPSTDITTSQPLPSLVLTQMPGYGPEQQSFLVTPSASGFSVPSAPSLLENGLAANELDLSYTPVEQRQQQLALQAAQHYDPQAEVKMVHRVPPQTEQQPKPDPVFWGGFLNKCRLAYDVFFPPKPVPRLQLSGKEVVMSRLQMVLVADRCGISPEALIAMKNSTVLGLAKYMEADMSEMEMQVSAVKPSGKRITMSLGFNKIMEDYMLRDPDNYHYQCEDDDDYFMEDDGYVSEIQERPTAGGVLSAGDQ